MAGLVATRLFAAAGAGGIALTAWALRRSGMEPRAGRLPHGRLHRAALRRLRRLAADRRDRARASACSRAAARSRSRSCRRSSRRSVLAGRPADRAAAGGRRAPPAALAPRAPGGCRAHWARAAAAPGAGSRAACAPRCDLVRAATPACSARSPGGASTSRVLWAMFHAFGDAAAVHRDLDGLLRRARSATCCRCPAASAASRAA